jgi:hypothetical protein
MAALTNPLASDPTPHAGTTPHQKIVCEFCGCQLAPSGEVLKLGDEAKKFRDHNESKEKMEKQISQLENENRELRATVLALTPRPKDEPVQASHRTLRRMGNN